MAWSKQKPLGEALLGIARELGPDQRMPTVRKLCASFGVSTSTLDPVLRDLETRGIIVRQHGRGIFVSPTICQKTIAVVFGGDIFSVQHSPFWTLMLQAVREQAGAHNFQLRAYMDIAQKNRELGGHAQLVEDLETRRLQGLFLLSPRADFDEKLQLNAYGVPLVVFGGQLPDWSVTHDFVRFYKFAAQELTTRNCRRVALMGQVSDADRALFEPALRTAGYRGDPLLDWSCQTWWLHIPANTREALGYELARRMIAECANTPLPDGLLSTDDTMTRGVVMALQQASLQPGRDLQIVTSANKGSPVLDFCGDALIQIKFDPAANVRAALAMLETLMNGGTPPRNPVLIAPRVRTGERVVRQ